MFKRRQKAFSWALITGLAMAPKTAKALNFEHHIQTSLAAPELWQLLVGALRGDMANGFWPTRYSTIKGSVEENGLVSETVFGASTVKYRLTQVVPGTRLTYSPLPGEAMQGRSHIEVLPQPGDAATGVKRGSILHWYGTYEVAPLSPVGLTIRLYEQLFFRGLQKNLQALAKNRESES